MKKLFALIIALLMLALSASCYAEDPLSEMEQQFVGSWTMYAQGKSGTIYSFIITFLDNRYVVQRSMVFENGALSTDNKASGKWLEFLSDTVILSLAGTDMVAKIKEDGNLYLYFYDELKLCGVYAKCPDMTASLGW